MNNYRLTFNLSTNILIQIGVYDVLQGDAYYYGFVKNNKPNISGFLNNLIPALSCYQEDLFRRLVKYNDGDIELAKTCAQNIHNVYLYPFAFYSDGVVNVPFRISKDKYEDFIVIHDELLAFYDTDFTNYIRTLLTEYASKTLGQREYLYQFKLMETLREAINKEKACKIYTNNRIFTFVPISLEISPIYGHNFIIGIDSAKQPFAVRLCQVQKIVFADYSMAITEEESNSVFDYVQTIYEGEYAE